MRSSLALLSALAATAYAQGTAVAASTIAPSSTAVGCNACFFQAGVAQVIFADFTQTQTATAVISAGRNGTLVSTTIFQPAQPFSFGASGLLGGSTVAGSYIGITGSTIAISGAILTSPTAYNVFTAFTSVTETMSGGSCVTSTGTTSILNSAISYSITDGSPVASQVLAAQMSFINTIGGGSCQPGSVIISSTIPFSVTSTTTTSTQSVFSRPSSLPESTAAASTAAASTSAVSSNVTAAGTSTSIVLLTPTASIVMGEGSTVHPRAFSASLVVALLIIPGIAAWLL